MLHSFPRVLSPDYIQTQYVLFFKFPPASPADWGRRKAGVHPKITETRSCHLRALVIRVLLCGIWFTLGMLMHCVELGGGAD